MIIFLYGKDSYWLKQNLDKIVGEYKKKYSGLAFSVVDLAETDELAKLENAVKTVSFFDEKRLVVIKNSFGKAGTIAEFIKTWDLAGDKQRILVFVENADMAQQRIITIDTFIISLSDVRQCREAVVKVQTKNKNPEVNILQGNFSTL